MTELKNSGTGRHYFFAGGGTGGHIYPAIAVAEQIKKIDADAQVTFFCSSRKIDSTILSKTGFNFVALSAEGFSVRPDRLVRFVVTQLRSYFKASSALRGCAGRAVVIGTGGFVSAPVVLAAHKLKIPAAILNVDIVPGRANKLLARFAEKIFVQFDETAGYFDESKVTVTGCPLREGFANPAPQKAIGELRLDREKKIILVTGASSGAVGVNRAVCEVLGCLTGFADSWQIVHITGKGKLEEVSVGYGQCAVSFELLEYYDDMADLLAAADIVIGRAGAVSVAEYAAAGVATVCLPYPYHKDGHQYLNAAKLADAGAAVIVDQRAGTEEANKELAKQLLRLLEDSDKRKRMASAGKEVLENNAAERIAREIVGMKKCR